MRRYLDRAVVCSRWPIAAVKVALRRCGVHRSGALLRP